MTYEEALAEGKRIITDAGYKVEPSSRSNTGVKWLCATTRRKGETYISVGWSGSPFRHATVVYSGETPQPTPVDRVFSLTSGQDDSTPSGRGQDAGTGRSASEGGSGLHAETYDRVKNHKRGDEIVTRADTGWKLFKDIAKVAYRGYGRVILDGVMDEEFKARLRYHRLANVPVVRVEDA